MSVFTDSIQAGSGLRPYYLLWGFRKCGTTSLYQGLRRSGVDMPDWDESNIWIARPSEIEGLFRTIWRGHLHAPYLIDLSTLTHLSRVDPGVVLARFGFAPRYLICTRAPGARWVSAFGHMARKRADLRPIRDYLDFYQKFVGLSCDDLVLLEDDLIHRDLSCGNKSRSGVMGAGYFGAAYPAAFTADPTDRLYAFRYFKETVDMLGKRPPGPAVELPAEVPEHVAGWVREEFEVQWAESKTRANRSSLFNSLRYHPAVRSCTRRIPRALRHSVATMIEEHRWAQSIGGERSSRGAEAAMAELVDEMLRPLRGAA